jgi:hypothetical protein
VNFVLGDVVTIPVRLVVGCTWQIASQLQPRTAVVAPDTTASIRSAKVDLRRSMAMGERSGRSHESINPLLFFLRRNRLSAARISRPGPQTALGILGLRLSGGWRRDELEMKAEMKAT